MLHKKYAVTIKRENGQIETHRNVPGSTLLDGLTTFGGIQLYVNHRDTIVEYKEENFQPSNSLITCDGKFGCE